MGVSFFFIEHQKLCLVPLVKIVVIVFPELLDKQGKKSVSFFWKVF